MESRYSGGVGDPYAIMFSLSLPWSNMLNLQCFLMRWILCILYIQTCQCSHPGQSVAVSVQRFLLVCVLRSLVAESVIFYPILRIKRFQFHTKFIWGASNPAMRKMIFSGMEQTDSSRCIPPSTWGYSAWCLYCAPFYLHLITECLRYISEEASPGPELILSCHAKNSL